MKLIRVVILSLPLLTGVPVFAQAKATNTDMQTLSDKVKDNKKQVVAANMNLNEAEGKAFWPIYDAYQKDLQVLKDRFTASIRGYADAYNKDVMTDELANRLIEAALAIEQDEVTMRKAYATRLSSVLPGKKVARYLQIENKIAAVIRFELVDGIPLVP